MTEKTVKPRGLYLGIAGPAWGAGARLLPARAGRPRLALKGFCQLEQSTGSIFVQTAGNINVRILLRFQIPHFCDLCTPIPAGKINTRFIGVLP